MPKNYCHNDHNFHENEMITFFDDFHHMVNGQKWWFIILFSSVLLQLITSD